MANQITDNRTVIDLANSAGSYVSSAGVTLDTEIKVEGTGSIAEQFSNNLRYLMYDFGSTQNLSNNVIYLWVNCGIVGLLDTKANGGFRIRVAGSNVADYKDWYVGGSDSWPIAVEGGWVQFVVDLEATADAAAGAWTTTQANTAIQHVGIAGQTSGTMTRNQDNTWLDASFRLPDGTPGIKVEGRNGGTTDWTWADILTQLGVGSGALKAGPGGSFILNTSIQFGENDTSTHGFTDTNKIILLDDQDYIPADNYFLSVVGNSGGTTNFTLGTKTGTGNDAVGSQGCTIAAASTGVRWDWDLDDPNVDLVGLYGCSFIHGGDFQMDDAAVDAISNLYIDGTSAVVSNSNQLKNTIINPNTADGAAYMSTDDLGDIKFCTFEFSDGHGIEILSGGPASQNNVGNLFNGSYGGTPGDNLVASSGSTDAMIYNNSGAAKTFNRSDGGTQPSFRNGASATSDDVASITLTFTPLKTNSEVRIYQAGTSTEITGVENSGTSFAAGGIGAGQNIDYKIINPGWQEIFIENVNFGASQNIQVNQQVDRNYA